MDGQKLNRADFRPLSVVRMISDVYTHAPGSRPWPVIGCLIVAAFLEFASIGLVLPLMGLVAHGSAAGSSRLSSVSSSLFELVGFVPSVGQLLSAVAIILVLKELITFAAMTYVAHSVAAVGTLFRRGLLTGLMQARWSLFTEEHPAKVAQALSADAAAAAEAYRHASLAVVEVIKIGVALLIAWLISGVFFLVVLITATVIAVVLYRLISIRNKNFRTQWTATADFGAAAYDVLSVIKVLKGMGRQRHYSKLLERSVDRIRTILVRTHVTRFAITSLQEIVVGLLLCGGLYVGFVHFGMTLPEIMVLAIVFLILAGALRALKNAVDEFCQNFESFLRCRELVAKTTELAEDDTGTQTPDLSRDCEFRNVSFSYADKPVLVNSNLKIPAGKITVITGLSGAGKTTTVDILAGFHRPSSGDVFIDGIPLKDVSLKHWRSQIGYVPQELVLVGGTILDNVSLGDPDLGEAQVWEALKLAGLEKFVRDLPDGLDTRIGNQGLKLSGGERQRLSLARALVLSPRLIILDEVTSALDEQTEAAICRNVAGLGDRHTIVAITHRPNWIQIADCTYRIEAGQAVIRTHQGSAPRFARV